MNAQVSIDAGPLSRSMKRLIELFDGFRTLLSEQIGHVVKQDFDAVNQFTDRQMALNESLSLAEAEFVAHLHEVADKVGVSSSEPSISLVAPHVANSVELTELKDELSLTILEARNRQVQLLELLHFGQRHISDTLKAIHHLSGHHDMRYNQQGRVVETNRGKMVNQKG
jgi:hypothetical protein